MKVLITGGAGFLGLHLTEYFASCHSRPVSGYGVNSGGNLFNIVLTDIAEFDKREYPKSVVFYKGDIRDSKTMKKLTRGVDFVVHAAAALPLWRKSDIFDINVNGTDNVLSACLSNKVKRVVYISSTAVYGVPKRHPIYENDPLVGVGPYGQSKIDAEKICEDFRNKGLIVTIIRPKTFVGTHRLGVFEILFDWIKDGKRIPVIGNGLNRYQLLDVDDLVEAIYLCLINNDEKKINNTFNIGAEKYRIVKEDLGELFDYAYSMLEQPLATDSVAKVRKSSIFSTPARPIKFALKIFEKLKLSPLYQWVYDTADKDSFVSIDRLIDTLNWHPKYSNSQALIKAYQWYLDNYDEIKSQTPGVTHTTGWKQGILGFFKRFM